MGLFGDTFLKLKYAVTHPGEAAGTVSRAVAAVTTGRPVPVTEISRAAAVASKPQIADAIAAPVALFAGGVSGVVAGAASRLTGGGKVSDAIVAHPLASTAAIAAAVVAPVAVGSIAAGGLRAGGSVAAAGIQAADVDEEELQQPRPKRKATAKKRKAKMTKPAAKRSKRKRTAKRKTKKRKKPSRKR